MLLLSIAKETKACDWLSLSRLTPISKWRHAFFKNSCYSHTLCLIESIEWHLVFRHRAIEVYHYYCIILAKYNALIQNMNTDITRFNIWAILFSAVVKINEIIRTQGSIFLFVNFAKIKSFYFGNSVLFTKTRVLMIQTLIIWVRSDHKFQLCIIFIRFNLSH